MTLVIMAAGMGSRFGGLKQIEPVGPNGEFIIDYSIYDAIKAGFDKIVIIIKEENYQDFLDTIGRRIEGKVDVEYVFQKMEDIPEGIDLPKDRVKPWGTAQALNATKNIIDGPFAVISADDFYGREPYKLLVESLKNNEYSAIGYKIGNTLTDVGAVKRGVCFSENGYLTKIIESKVKYVDGKIIGEPLNGDPSYEMDSNQSVSMLMFGLEPSLFDYIKDDIKEFFKKHEDDLSKCEYLLPDVLGDMLKKDKVKIKLIETSAVWKGVTYKEDLEELKKYINEEIDAGVYPKNLYGRN